MRFQVLILSWGFQGNTASNNAPRKRTAQPSTREAKQRKIEVSLTADAVSICYLIHNSVANSF